jgi:hypothetical protein
MFLLRVLQLIRRAYARAWALHSPVLLIASVSSEECLRLLTLAAKPSQQRLHLRDLFSEGRRYYLSPHKEGFRLQSSSKYPWGGKQRTPFTADLIGSLTPVSDNITSVRLRVRTNWLYVLRGLFVPAWMASIVIFLPYPPVLVTGLIIALFGLSLLGSRLNASLQATHLIFFVQKALEELPPVDLPLLPAAGIDVVQQPDFQREWDRFYRRQRAKEGSSGD